MRAHIDRPEFDDSYGDRLVRRLANPKARLGIWSAIAIGLSASLLVAWVEAITGPGLVFLMPLALVVAATAWLSKPPAWIVTAILGSAVWSYVKYVEALSDLERAEVLVGLVIRVFALLILGFFVYQLRRSVETQRRLAVRDPLTGLLNRRGFFEVAEREAARSRREGTPVTVALIDLDDFKRVNDSFGHETGDEVLRDFAEHAASRLRATDVLGRVGGDEFAVLLLASAHDAHRVLESLVRAPDCGPDGDVTCSVGAVGYEVPPSSIDKALAQADEQM